MKPNNELAFQKLHVSDPELNPSIKLEITLRKPKLTITLTAILMLPAYSVALAEIEGITSGKQLQAAAETRARAIKTGELQREIATNPDLVLIDVRMPSEIAKMGGTVDAPQNNNIPRGWLEHRVTNVARNKDVPIVVYCGAGIRSPMAAVTLEDMGYTDVRDYPEGFIGWRQANLPVKPPQSE